MSATDILEVLPKLTPSELRAIRARLFEMETSAGSTFPRNTLADLVRVLRSTPADADFADDLETVNRADRPLANPWDS